MEKLSPKEMAKTICQLKEAIQLITINTDRLIFANKKIMQLEQEVFHEKWKVRYLTRRIKAIDPDAAVTEEELDRQIRGGMN